MPRMPALLRLLAALLVASLSLVAQQPDVELAITRMVPTVDGDLADWPKSLQPIVFGRAQVVGDPSGWQGDKDASGRFLIGWDNNHLYLSGTVRDDQIVADDLAAPARSDCLELRVGPGGSQLQLFPLQAHRPWSWGGTKRAPADAVQASAQLAGIAVVGRPIDGGYEFEAAIPWHHFAGVVSGATSVAFDLRLRDCDRQGESTLLAWAAGEQAEGLPGARLRVQEPGVLAPVERRAPLLSGELIGDLPYLIVPLLSLLGLVLLLRGWARIRGRVPWLRSALVFVGVATFLVGLWYPTLRTSWRAEDQREQLVGRLSFLQKTLDKAVGGSLASYRGASRDRAVVDLVSGRAIARQRYTTFRSLVDVVPDQFGPPLRFFDDLPVRCYWLPLASERAARLQFDPPLQGRSLHLVLARPLAPAFSFAPPDEQAIERIELGIDYGEDKTSRSIELALPFTDATTLGREFWEACVVPIELDRDVRALTIAGEGNPDLRLVGVSLEGDVPGQIEPMSLGEPSRDGVLTDLRGPYPRDAGIELAPGATAKVTIPEQHESPQRLWFFYRAVYPGLPSANPGARVAEVTLHFADGRQKDTHVLEHQVSMFYELAVHNTRDEPPKGSAASIALSWVDESQERHVNLGYPVPELPSDTALSAIEFKNLADYRIRFRSVVLVNERAVAPQDPPDSPLLREGLKRRLDPAALDALDDVVISIYRTGELSESTLPAGERQDVQALPRAVGSLEVEESAGVLPDGSRRLTLFAPLRGDGWDGAMLAISSRDQQWTAAMQSNNRVGLLLCLLSTPFLLVLLSELLAVVTNLRFRLMTVLSVASLAPLGLLSFVLVQVLESGHASKVESSVRDTMESALAQLDGQKLAVQQSAQQWLRDLVTLADEKLQEREDVAEAAVAESLQALLNGQLPPEWRDGFLRLEWHRGEIGKADPKVLVAGDARMVQAEAPARLDPGLFMQWGRLMLGVRAEQRGPGGVFALTAGRPLDGSLLGALAPGHNVLLTDVRGYPLAAGDGGSDAERLLRAAYDPAAMSAREEALANGEELRRPVIRHASTPVGDQVVGSEVLRDLQETPRGLLLITRADERATLDLAIGRIPVRAFFLLVAGSLVVLAAFLSFVVSGRISRPIERLEHGAQALSRGVLDTRVPNDEGGQVGRLTRAFNQMAEDLQGRLQDLQALNRTMGDLAAEHDEGTAIEVLRRFCATHTGADAVVALMLDEDGDGLLLYAGGEAVGERIELGGWSIASLVGPFCHRVPQGVGSSPWREALPQCRSMLGLPIAFAGQARGVVLLGFTFAEPIDIDLELVSTVVAQAASACERSRLQRLAVQDPVTGAFASEYFRRRVVDEVTLSQHGGKPLALLAFVVGERNRSAVGLLQFTSLLRRRLPSSAVVGHEGSGLFHVVLPGADRSAAEELRQTVAAEWRAEKRRHGVGDAEREMATALSVHPSEAPSAEFLFEAVGSQLRADPIREAVEAESDASLLRAGVTAVSPVMRPVYSTLRRVAPTDLPILLEGETGVGKEVLTDLVHRWSRRSGGPLVKVHCAALSETLLASELFGHERGAFTGADRRKIGRFEQAHGGTLFLDEVGEIPLDVQVTLLRVLQEGEVDRVGGVEPVKVDVRVIAATNRDMTRMVAEGRFREDLYYRLQGMVVKVPPLRERKEELARLVECFRRDLSAGGHAPDHRMSPGAMDELYRQEWPGNIRQLRTTVFRALVLAAGSVVTMEDVRAALAGDGGAALPELPPGVGGEGEVEVAPAAAEPASEAVDPIGADEAGGAEAALEPPVVLVPKEPPSSPRPSPSPESDLSPRLLQLWQRVQARGRYRTQDHMEQAGLSHRTALRDLQALVKKGLVERVGSRRGAHYRPLRGAANSVDSDARGG